MKRILEHLRNGGEVYSHTYEMHVLAVFDTPMKKELYLGDIDTKKLYLIVSFHDEDIDDYSFD